MDNTAAQTIHLLLLDDHEMFRQGLARVLEKEPGLKVVAQIAGQVVFECLPLNASNSLARIRLGR